MGLVPGQPPPVLARQQLAAERALSHGAGEGEGFRRMHDWSKPDAVAAAVHFKHE